MTTTKSYSDKSRFFALYRAALKQQVPFGIVAGILFILIIPLPYFVDQIYRTQPPFSSSVAVTDLTTRWRNYFSAGVYLDEAQAVLITLVLLVMGLTGALMQTSFLHSKKMTDLYHSMPVRRPSLLTAVSLASVTAIFVPLLAVYLVTMIAQFIMYGQYLVGYGWYFQFIGIDLAAALVTLIAVYAFTVFISVHVGTVFDSFALTGVLGFLPLFFYGIVMSVWASHTYGASSSGIERVFLWLSPFTFSFQRFVYIGGINLTEPGAAEAFLGVVRLLSVWLVIAGGFYAMAIVGYNRRKSELAEQTQPQGVFQMIGKCFAAFCGSALFYGIFYDSQNLFVWIVAGLFGGVLIGLVAELILSRGIRSIRRNLKWLAGAGALFCLVVIAVRFDFTGYETRVPNAENVESVTIGYRGRFDALSDSYQLRNYYYEATGWDYQYRTVLSDPANIAIVTDMHRTAVDNRPDDSGGYSYNGYSGDEYSYNWIEVEYKLKNGGTMARSYNKIYGEAYRELVQLEVREEFIRQNHAIFILEDLEGKASAADHVDTITVYNAYGGNGKPYKPTRDETRRLLEAARQDMLAESLEELTNPTEPAYGYMEIQFQFNQATDRSYSSEYATCSVIIGQGYANTIQVLRELGMWGDVDYTLDVDEVRFYPADYAGYTPDIVFVLLPGRMPGVSTWRYDYSGKEEPLPYITDAAEIRQVLEAARNQMLADRSQEVYVAAYYQDGIQIGGQLIRRDDLPENAEQQIARFNEMREGNVHNYPIYAESVVPMFMDPAGTTAEVVQISVA